MANDESRNKRSPQNGDHEDQPSAKRARGDYDSIDSEIRMMLPSKNAGAVIGKGGENIKRLRQEFQARITLPDSPGPERLMIVRGEIGQICGIVGEIIPLLDKPDRGTEDDCDVRMLVHQSHAGRIIGKGGDRIKELKEETETQIRVYTECCPESTDRCCQILGKPSQIVACVGRILEMLDATPTKGMNVPYDPNNFDESFANKYGGFIGFRGGPGGGRMGGRDKFDRGDRRGGMRGGRGGRGGFDRDGGRDFGGGRGGGRDFGGGRGGGRDFGGSRGDRDFGGGRDFGGRGGGGGFNRMGDGLLDTEFGGGAGFSGFGGMKNIMGGGMEKTTTSQVSIPKSLAGAIIGKGGTRIRQVQMESGTVINMDDAATDSEERIITIHGTQEQIQYAQYLLQMTVKQHAGV